jgi:hypothetical protein
MYHAARVRMESGDMPASSSSWSSSRTPVSCFSVQYLADGFRILFSVGVGGYDTDVDSLESFELYSAAMRDEIAHARNYLQVLRQG